MQTSAAKVLGWQQRSFCKPKIPKQQASFRESKQIGINSTLTHLKERNTEMAHKKEVLIRLPEEAQDMLKELSKKRNLSQIKQ